MKYLKTLIIASLALSTFSSCNDGKKASVKVGDKEVSVEIDNEMNDFETKMKNFGARIDKKIAEIDAKMEDAGEEMQEDLAQEKAKWRETRNNLDARMKRFNQNAKNNWSEFKSDTKAFFDKVENEFE